MASRERLVISRSAICPTGPCQSCVNQEATREYHTFLFVFASARCFRSSPSTSSRGWLRGSRSRRPDVEVLGLVESLSWSWYDADAEDCDTEEREE